MMIARLTAVATLLALALQPAVALSVTSATHFGPPTIRLEAADTLHASRHALVQLPAGHTALTLPLAELGVSADDAILSVQPDDSVRLVAVHSDDDGARWMIESSRDVEATLALTYPVEDLSWAIEYAATLTTDGSLDLDASLRLTNDSARDLEDARLVGDFARATLSLDAGQSVTVAQPWLSATISADDLDRSLVYDKDRHGDSVVELLTISGDAPARATALASGSVRIYADPADGGEFIRQTSIPYTAPGEAIELALGPASGVIVTRTLDKSEEVNKRLDARDKIAVFDLRENWLLEVRNLRDVPIDLTVREYHDGAWRLEQCSDDCERVDAETLKFNLTVEPGERREVTFCIRHEHRQP
ncbi:MAG: hypothetical protein ACLFU7_11785 [Armatimonadota bacterium]